MSKANAKKKKRKKSLEERFVIALRNEWRRYSPERKAALARRKVKGVGNGYLCEWCCKLTTDWDCDHVIPVGVRPGSRNATDETDWNGWIDRLNCSASGLQLLCRECHRIKTKDDRNKSWE